MILETLDKLSVCLPNALNTAGGYESRSPETQFQSIVRTVNAWVYILYRESTGFLSTGSTGSTGFFSMFGGSFLTKPGLVGGGGAL